MGFPDVESLPVRGGPACISVMDPLTLATVLDRCVKRQFMDHNTWTRLAERAQRLCNTVRVPNVCFIYRSFAHAQWSDDELVTSYLGRIHRLIPTCRLADVGVLLEAFRVPAYRSDKVLDDLISHATALLIHRTDATGGDLGGVLRGLLVLDERTADVYALLKLIVKNLSRIPIRQIPAAHLTVVLEALRCLCPRQAAGAMRAVCYHLLDSKMDDLDCRSLVRLTHSYLTCRQFQCQAWNNPEEDTLSDPIAIDLLQRIMLVSCQLTCFEVIRCLTCIDVNTLTNPASHRLYEEFSSTLLRCLPRSLLPDFWNAPMEETCNIIKYLVDKGQQHYVTTCLLPILSHRLPTYSARLLAQLFRATAPLLQGQFPNATNFQTMQILRFHGTVITRLCSQRLTLDEAWTLLEALGTYELSRRYPRFTSAVLEQLTARLEDDPTVSVSEKDVALVAACCDNLPDSYADRVDSYRNKIQQTHTENDQKAVVGAPLVKKRERMFRRIGRKCITPRDVN